MNSSAEIFDRALDPDSLRNRLRIGFQLRRTELSSLIQKGHADARINGDPQSHKASSGVPQTGAEDREQINLRSLSQRFLPPSLSISDYISHLRPLLPQQYRDVLLGYYFSGEYISDPEIVIRSSYYDEAQFSVVCETLNAHQDARALKHISKDIRAQASDLLNLARGAHPKPISSLQDFRKIMERFGVASNSAQDTLGEFNNYLSIARTQLVHSLGPDIFTLFQQLCDPEFSFPRRSVLRHLDYARKWNCSDLFTRMLMVRASRGTPADLEALNVLNNAILKEDCLEVSRQTVALYKAWSEKSSYSLAKDKPWPANALHHLCGIRHAVDMEDPEDLVEQLLQLYNVDPQIMEWVNWDEVYQIFRYSDKQEGMQISIVHLIMGQPFVGRKFPLVKMAEGDGAFESSLRTSVSKLEHRSINTLAQEILKASGNCRQLLVHAVLNQDTAAMLAIMLRHDSQQAKRQAKSVAYDARVSSLRSEIANSFAAHGLLTKRQAEIIVEQESSRVRVAYLHGRQLEGLVHINWPSVSEQINQAFDGQISLVRRLLNVPDLDRRDLYLSSVVKSLAQKIANFLLIDGPDDIKTIVSDSLRHGQLPNRFLLAFDRAVSHAIAAPIDVNSLIIELKGNETKNVHWLVHLREKLVSDIRLFNEQCLTVWGPSEFQNQVVDIATQWIRHLLEDSGEGGGVNIGDCLPRIEALLKDFFVAARRELSVRIASYLDYAKTFWEDPDEALNVDTNPQYGPNLDKRAFVGALHEYTAEAEHDALLWIAMATSEEIPEAFQFSDLIQLCLFNYRSGGSRDIPVNVLISENRRDRGIVVSAKPPMIKGQYFEVMEIIAKNILSNAFTHSGLGLNARVRIELVLDQGRFTIKARNAVSAARYAWLKKNLKRLVVEARKDNPMRAGEDEGSGLQKIRRACRRYLGVIPTIHLAVGALWFEISVDVRHQYGSITTE